MGSGGEQRAHILTWLLGTPVCVGHGAHGASYLGQLRDLNEPLEVLQIAGAVEEVFQPTGGGGGGMGAESEGREVVPAPQWGQSSPPPASHPLPRGWPKGSGCQGDGCPTLLWHWRLHCDAADKCGSKPSAQCIWWRGRSANSPSLDNDVIGRFIFLWQPFFLPPFSQGLFR